MGTTRLPSEELRPAALAAALSEMARRLASALPNVLEEQTRATLETSLERVRSVCASLRSIEVLYDPDLAREFTRQAGGLRRAAAAMADSVEAISRANESVAAKFQSHVEDLEEIAQLPPDGDIGSRLLATVERARAMADEVYQTLEGVTRKVGDATRDVQALERELNAARERALTDALTNIHNRAAFEEQLAQAVEEKESKGPWCVALVSVDNFQAVQESHGAIVGDALLFKIARGLEEATRGDEAIFLARYGGKEFALIIRNRTPEQALPLLEAIRQKVEASRWQDRQRPEAGVVTTTVSLAVTRFLPGDSPSDLIERAASALEKAQQAGGNRLDTA